MPLYDFECNSCGKTFEALIQSAEKPACVHCGKDDARKLIASHSVYVIQGDNSASTRPKAH